METYERLDHNVVWKAQNDLLENAAGWADTPALAHTTQSLKARKDMSRAN